MNKLVSLLSVVLSINAFAGSDSDTFRAKFDLRDFHDFILALGSVPLDILKDEVHRWVNEQGES